MKGFKIETFDWTGFDIMLRQSIVHQQRFGVSQMLIMNLMPQRVRVFVLVMVYE